MAPTETLAPPGFGAAIELRCRECGATSSLTPAPACAECFAPLEIGYDHDALGAVTRASIERGPLTLWRYAGLLPAPRPEFRVDLGAGWSRLVRADNLARALGMRRLWVKDESSNPTHSFKDRVVATAVSAARAFGYGVVACASTGNLANALAAAAARTGLRAVVLVPADLEPAKVVASAVYAPTLVAVDGSYDDVNRLCSELAGELSWGFVNVNLRAFYAEGSKTLGYEIAEQLGWRLPQQVVVPVASGSLLTKVDRAWRDLGDIGLVEPTPYRVFGAQADGCAPVATAYANGWDTVRPVRPSTVAKSLAIGNPADGPYAIDVARRTGGAIASVSDDEIVAGMRLLAGAEGIFPETAGGVTVATLRRLLRTGALDPDAETVVVNTGDGLKTVDAVAPQVGPTAVIRPSLDAFVAAGLGEENR
jgi:threonine synthase